MEKKELDREINSDREVIFKLEAKAAQEPNRKTVKVMAGVLSPFLKWFIGGSSAKGPRNLNCVVRSPWSTVDIVGQKLEVEALFLASLFPETCVFTRVELPILFLSGLQDEMVPPPHMKTLYVKAATRNKNCIFVEFPNGMHMDTWVSGGDLYWNTVRQFLEQNASGKKHNITHQSENDSETRR
ncbi:hypothetical protein MKW98_002257 [Papaver atlanticum]|uniref:Peptidase S9 prolyl oligopeptidase catalytic domain-containing protein n=1 Tax=Papaver atlanticum TaxID=357466 RepID=A0AAD4X3X3_9MAGN|nr:hypothetical protein MKW98_002257 [Papaver atlanticum]